MAAVIHFPLPTWNVRDHGALPLGGMGHFAFLEVATIDSYQINEQLSE